MFPNNIDVVDALVLLHGYKKQFIDHIELSAMYSEKDAERLRQSARDLKTNFNI
jgi:hypothetical protein